MSKNRCDCKNDNYAKLGAVSTFKLFPIFDRKFVTEKKNTRTEIITKLNDPNFSLNVERSSCNTCDDLMTKQQKLEIKKKPTPFRMPYNHYRKTSTCRGGMNDFNTSGGKRTNGECK